MALLTPDDIQDSLNIDLTDPEGQLIAESLIAASQEWLSSQLGYPVEEREVTKYFDGQYHHLWLPTAAPVSNLVLSTYNSTTNSYDTIPSTYLRTSGNEVFIDYALPYGFHTVRAVYTTGWTAETLPADLKRALIELVGLKLQEVTNYSTNPDDPAGDGSGSTTGPLKRVNAGSYSEEYATGQADALWKAKAAQLSRGFGDSVPPGIQAVISSYGVHFAI
jgi:hypothetical protein